MTLILKKITSLPIFQGLDEDQLTELISTAERREYKKGDIIFTEGDEGNGLYVVETGKIKIFKLSFEGKEHIFHIYGPGKMFGEVAVFSGKKFPAFAQALYPSSLIFFPRKEIALLISENPSLAFNMLASLSMRLREFTIMVENLALKDVPARMASYLIVLCKEQKNTDAVDLPVTKNQIAGLLGTTPETISRVFNRMVSEKLINVDNKIITILDYQGLAELSEQG